MKNTLGGAAEDFLGFLLGISLFEIYVLIIERRCERDGI
jgi:hypothetical protein